MKPTKAGVILKALAACVETTADRIAGFCRHGFRCVAQQGAQRDDAED
jgi:hypothetical protein